ncbi:hypothetical protein ANRL3_00650 [Anaerolineae bacterium]|nr:hypothetical protein ANRL3_00650 [Anaerolineae bacterium]
MEGMEGENPLCLLMPSLPSSPSYLDYFFFAGFHTLVV